MDSYLDTLHQYFGYDSFRGIQLDIIKSIYEGHDTLGLMPTGAGKSITFQIPALMMSGVCIIITPLISLMKDQVMHLKQHNISAEAIYSGLTKQEIQRILDNTIYGAVKFLYVSPERLQNKLFLAKLYYMKVCFITIDEAHCISQWGYDFRPSYLEIKKLRELKPEVPVLALTATATPDVAQDIQDKLDFGHDSQSFRMSFKRPNLHYVVRHASNKKKELIHILTNVEGSSIVYVRSRKKTKEYADFLNDAGIQSTFYHAGLDIAIKNTRQEEWQNDSTRVMVATNAFGMGIDKPDVRIVVHIDAPSSLEEYFQEAGRSGRDGQRAYAVMLYCEEDRQALLSRISKSFPAKEQIKEIYDHLAYFFQLAEDTGAGARYEFNMAVFCYRFHHFPTYVNGALGLLQNAGYIEYNPEPDSDARIMFTIQRHELYDIQGLSKLEDDVMTILMRYYGSLFSELTYINEAFLLQKLGIDEHHLHFALKSLAQKHILRYVPKRNVPIITYKQQRINSARLSFPKNVYEDMMARMAKRIDAVLDYLDNKEKCRQNVLLEYFGEKTNSNCKHCDICLQNSNLHTSQNARDKIVSLLNDGQKHCVTELSNLGISTPELHNTLEKLRNNEEISIMDSFIILKE